MIASELAELADIIDREFTRLGQSATHAELMESVTIPDHIVDYLARRGMSSRINAYFSARRDDGLPFAPVVNTERVHVPLALAAFDEIEFYVVGCTKLGDAKYAQARRGAALARERFGRSIVVDGVDLSADESAVAS